MTLYLINCSALWHSTLHLSGGLPRRLHEVWLLSKWLKSINVTNNTLLYSIYLLPQTYTWFAVAKEQRTLFWLLWKPLFKRACCALIVQLIARKWHRQNLCLFSLLSVMNLSSRRHFCKRLNNCDVMKRKTTFLFEMSHFLQFSVRDFLLTEV